MAYNFNYADIFRKGYEGAQLRSATRHAGELSRAGDYYGAYQALMPYDMQAASYYRQEGDRDTTRRAVNAYAGNNFDEVERLGGQVGNLDLVQAARTGRRNQQFRDVRDAVTWTQGEVRRIGTLPEKERQPAWNQMFLKARMRSQGNPEWMANINQLQRQMPTYSPQAYDVLSQAVMQVAERFGTENWEAYLEYSAARANTAREERKEARDERLTNAQIDALRRRGGEGATRVQSSDILEDGTVIAVHSNGKTSVIDAQGNELTGQARADAVQRARSYGTDIQGNRAGARAGAVNAQEIAAKGFESLNNVRANLRNLDDVIKAIDAGASSGVIENQIPIWTASTIQLRNLQSRLGLDVVGAVTFGALSEGELRLALDVALPTNLSSRDLKKWVVDKKAAQQKLATYLEAQVRYLSQPGNTVGGWLESQTEQRLRPGGGAPAATPPQGRNVVVDW